MNLLYRRQLARVFSEVKTAFENKSGAQLMILARSKQTLNALTNQVEKEVKQEYRAVDGEPCELKVVRINASMQTGSEMKIHQKFCESFNLDTKDRGVTQEDLKNSIVEQQERFPDYKVLFIFEDIDFYVESTK